MVAVTLTPKELCDLCHPLLRFFEACPQNPDLLTWPQMITKEELWTSEQLADMRAQHMEYRTFREILLLNENMKPLVMNLLLYGASALECMMTWASFFAPCIPILLTALFVHTRKQKFCRALVMWLSAKTCFFWIFFFCETFKMPKSDSLLICQIDGSLHESAGFSEHCFLISSFLTYLVLSSLLSLNRNVPISLVTAAESIPINPFKKCKYYAIFGVIYIIILYLSKMYLAMYSQACLMTSIEVGMGFAIMFMVIMIVTNLWPLNPQAFHTEVFPTEEFLLNHLCLKWDIDIELPKLEKLSRIKQTLEDALKVKAEFDQRARELAK